jgi:hypothetical protein
MVGAAFIIVLPRNGGRFRSADKAKRKGYPKSAALAVALEQKQDRYLVFDIASFRRFICVVKQSWDFVFGKRSARQ